MVPQYVQKYHVAVSVSPDLIFDLSPHLSRRSAISHSIKHWRQSPLQIIMSEPIDGDYDKWRRGETGKSDWRKVATISNFVLSPHKIRRISLFELAAKFHDQVRFHDQVKDGIFFDFWS